MSGQWEVVGKKNKGAKSAPLKENKKKAPQNGPKVEEVLPVSQIKSLFKSEKTTANAKESKKQKEKVVAQENGTKKQKKVDKPPGEQPKPKPPKNIESALTGISADEFKNVFETSKTGFPEMPIVWLKELAQFLNKKVPVEVADPVFRNKPFDYPLSAVPTPLKAVIERATKEAGKSNVQTFFNISLTAMATDMSRGSPALGHKLLLQYIAASDPKSAAANLANCVSLRNSYQNRPPIGLSILWAMGQVGVKDLQLGLKVFDELMLPLVELKNYSCYVIEYLVRLLGRHKEAAVGKEELLSVLDVVFSKRKLPSDAVPQLDKAAVELSGLFERNKESKSCVFVEPLLRKLGDVEAPQNQNVVCGMLASCLVKDQSSFGSWSKVYAKSLPQSAVFLNYISKNWKTLSSKVSRSVLSDTVASFSAVNQELQKKKRKEPGLANAVAAIKNLQDKMTAKKKSGFPFKKLSFVLFLVIGGIVYYDCRQQGNWNNSKTRQLLHDLGICKYSKQGFDYVKEGALAVDKYAHDNYPEYYKKTAEFLQPYQELAKNTGLVLCNVFENVKEYTVEKYPIVLKTIESYAPGFFQQSQKTVNEAVSVSVFYFNRSVDFLKNEVFVGQLSPENMQRVVAEAFNTTQQKAVEYYQWIYEKIRVTIS